MFIDSSYEGDLMAQAGVRYTYGREGSSQYQESLAGVRDRTPFHQFLVDVSPYDARRQAAARNLRAAAAGAGKRRQGGTGLQLPHVLFRGPGESRPLRPPAGYDPRRYALFARLLEARLKAEGTRRPRSIQ